MARKRNVPVRIRGAEPAKRRFIEREELPPASVRALEQIEPRTWGDTRRLDPSHVVALAESIAALGLLEPLVIDRDDRLLAGAHRLAALKVLAAGEGAQAAQLIRLFEGREDEITHELRERAGDLDGAELDVSQIPVRPVDFSSGEDANRALAIEASENEQRRDYTRDEVREIYETLKARGFTDRRGRPAKGEKAARPAIAAIIGKSMRTVHRLLEPPKKKTQRAKNMTPVILNETTPTPDPIPSGEAEQLPLGAPARAVEWDEPEHDTPPVEKIVVEAQAETPELNALVNAARAYLTMHRETGQAVYVTAALEIVAAFDRKD